MQNIYDLIIIGSGPAGLAAAIYAQRAQLSAVVLEKEGEAGGQITSTFEVDNYPGMPGVSGSALAQAFREHAEKLGAQFVQDEVTGAALTGRVKTLFGRKEQYQAYTVILAMGAHHRTLGIPGEDRLAGRGVSYCALCDGGFFRGQEVVVVGGGDSALTDALYLSRIASHVLLVHRRNELRASKDLQARIKKCNNIEICWNTVLGSIDGDDQVEQVILKSVKTGVETEYPCGGVFIAAGIVPENVLVQDLVDISPEGYILAGEDTVTSLPGVFAAGDIRRKNLRQIVTAVADGANAVNEAEKYVQTLDKR